jgi:hypothetical protein
MIRRVRQTIALILLTAFANSMPAANACGPFSIDPIFVFETSPDLPFAEYARGNVGIVRPSFGRKTLVIAYRYLNGGWFGDSEQAMLVDALKGTAPEGDGVVAVKAWVAARKEIVKEEKPPEIYTERQYDGGYDFFPNCARNAFEVATATLKDRAANYGAEDVNVRDWIAAQDIVFQNCQGGGALPADLGPASPKWLQKDRDYQIAAALLYSLKFEEARTRFETIAADVESPWQVTAEYLVPRTLVRQASLTGDEKKRRDLYDQAEQRLRILAARRTLLSDAAQKLLGLVEYRAHPEARVRELAQSLSHDSGTENLKQDLIDYTWLLDKLEDRILKEEEKRKQEAEAAQKKNTSDEKKPGADLAKQYEAMARGELINVLLIPTTADGKPDTTNMGTLFFKPEVTEAEVAKQFEAKIGRPLVPDEREQLNSAYELAQKSRAERLSPNNRLSREGLTGHEGCGYYDECERLPLHLIPDYLSDDLSDWIFTVQGKDPAAYDHALAKYRESRSTAWLVASLIKATRASARLEGLMQDAQTVDRNSPAFPTIAFHLIRIKTEQGKASEARKLSDQILGFQFERLPVSARNQFLEQRARLSDNVTDFLRYGQRRAVAFSYEGALGSMRDLARVEKGHWDLYEMWRPRDGEEPRQTREEYDQSIDDEYKDKLPWDDRVFLDERTIEIINWHFPLVDLEQAARNPILPDYVRRTFALAVWTRAIVLQNREVANRIAPDVLQLAPEMKQVFEPYLNAKTEKEKDRAALYVMLNYTSLSPLLTTGIPELTSSGDAEFYFESAWWCTPSNTEYNYKEERDVPKTVSKPVFLSAPQIDAARQERAALIALGDGRTYLGKRAIEWAKESPKDPRIPEALFIAAEANKPYKYGCKAWEGDQEIEKEAAAILLDRYSQSSWAAKLAAEDRQ